MQRVMSGFVREVPLDHLPHTIGGADVHYRFGKAVAAMAVLGFPDMQQVTEVSVEVPMPWPYVPGLLSLRELPPLLAAWAALPTRPDVLLCDAHGRAHPRRFGLASHFGLMVPIPVIGCAKRKLIGEYVEPGRNRGDFSWLLDSDERVGAAVRTQTGIRPVYVSVGNRITLPEAVYLVVKSATRYRLPEPLRRAHALASSHH